MCPASSRSCHCDYNTQVKKRPGLRQDRSAPVSDGRRSEQSQSRRGQGAAREGQGQPRLRPAQLRPQWRGWRRPMRFPRMRSTTPRTLLDQAQAQVGVDEADDRAARGAARRRAGQSRLHQHRFAGGRHRRVAQRHHGPDGGGELPDADAVPDRHRPHQDAGRHQCQRKRHRRHQGGQQGALHRRRLPEAHLRRRGRAGAPVAADGAERRDLRCRGQRRQCRSGAQAGHDRGDPHRHRRAQRRPARAEPGAALCAGGPVRRAQRPPRQRRRRRTGSGCCATGKPVRGAGRPPASTTTASPKSSRAS